MLDFGEFQKSFLKKLRLPLFGESETSRPGSDTSAATKELRKKGGYDIFTPEFVRSIYQVLCEHPQLIRERDRVRMMAKEFNLKLGVLRNEMEAVQAMKRAVEGPNQKNLDPSLVGSRDRLKEALQAYEADIRKQQEYFNSLVNPAVRKPGLGEVRWEPVLKPHKYSLPALKKKAPDQWVYEKLNEMLATAMKPLRISDITRYRVMSALLEYVGLNIKPVTFKVHRSRGRNAAKSVTKS